MAAAPRGGRRAAWDVMPAGLSPPPRQTPPHQTGVTARRTPHSYFRDLAQTLPFLKRDFLAPGRRAEDSMKIVKFMVAGLPRPREEPWASSLGPPRQPCSTYPFRP